MSEFLMYFQLGFEHISDLQGYDHILFIVSLCAIYIAAEWKQVLVLITAFTIGHSITLGLSTFDVLAIESSLIEFLIPITILLTCIFNFFEKSEAKTQKMSFRYFVGLFFGLIHGLGFSSYLKMLLGKSQSIVMQLLAFNVGLEIGQILIVIIVFILTFLVIDKLKIAREKWSWALSGISAIIAAQMIWERWIF